jgi:hypothetical protein
VNERAYYRVRFPLAERPSLLVGETTYPVLDFSEGGLCVGVHAPSLSLDDTVVGVVRFHDGEEFAIAGRVVREGQDNVGLLLDNQGIPFRKVIDEQRRLLTSYPQLRQSWRS